jgi:hypothetical protein
MHYGPKHNYADEWVFNRADIPNQRIVFARLYTPDSDLALTRELKDHDVWIADPDTKVLARIGPEQLASVSRER